MDERDDAVRIPASIKGEAERRIADCFRERARRADIPAALALLSRLGSDEAPRLGDDLS